MYFEPDVVCAGHYPYLIYERDPAPTVQMGEAYVIYSITIAGKESRVANGPAMCQYVAVSFLDERDGSNMQPVMAGSVVSMVDAKYFFVPDTILMITRDLALHIEAMKHPARMRFVSEGNFLMVEIEPPEQPIMH